MIRKLQENQMGEKLAQAFPNKTKIAICIVVRTCLVIVICLAGVRGINGIKEWFSSLKGIVIFCVLFAIGIFWGFYPLIHLRDLLIFYENGICVNKRNYLFSQIGKIRFCDYQTGILTHQMMQTDLRNFDVTYLARPKRAYNQAYLN